MGGKGRRRREKNYEAAHNVSHSRLPPPPDSSAIDAMPSKLRKLISFTGTVARLTAKGGKRIGENGGIDKDSPSGGGSSATETAGAKRKRDDKSLMRENTKHGNGDPKGSAGDKKKKKRKRDKAVDLRFENIEGLGATGSQRKERRKQRLQAKKKKNKKSGEESDTDFRGHEDIKFGDVVQAPPKLTVPKGFKSNQDASRERLRLQAVEAYRKRKGWESRPGVQLPPPVTTSSLF